MKIVVLGAKGMLGSDLVKACHSARMDVSGYDLPELNIAVEPCDFQMLPACDWIVNCAAYTDVDGSETNQDTAFAVNHYGAARVAEWAEARGISLAQISTDYVFDGNSRVPYREDDPVNPLNKYGESKLAGEQAVRAACKRSLIVRTQSLFGVNGKNFIRAIMNKLNENSGPLRVVSDQISSPTYTGHLACAILHLLKTGRYGIVNVSASGECSWHEFARAIAARVKPDAEIEAITTAESGRPARRPAYAVLDKSRYELWTGEKMPSWQNGLDEYLKCVMQNNKETV